MSETTFENAKIVAPEKPKRLVKKGAVEYLEREEKNAGYVV